MAVYGRNMSWIKIKVTVTILRCIVMKIYIDEISVLYNWHIYLMYSIFSLQLKTKYFGRLFYFLQQERVRFIHLFAVYLTTLWVAHNSPYIASNNWVMTNNEVEMTLKEFVVS
jgi:hypothetical protein